MLYACDHGCVPCDGDSFAVVVPAMGADGDGTGAITNTDPVIVVLWATCPASGMLQTASGGITYGTVSHAAWYGQILSLIGCVCFAGLGFLLPVLFNMKIFGDGMSPVRLALVCLFAYLLLLCTF